MRSLAAQRKAENRIKYYAPYAKQRAFHEAGATKRERLFRAGNQLGKSFAGGAEASYHLTGAYPDWWEGRRFERPVRAWLGGPSGELVRDGPQRVLLGPAEAIGTGALPKTAIEDWTRATGVRDLADTITVKHVSGGTSRIKLKTYDQGRLRWQAETLDFVWFDEEPPQDIYVEGLSRTNATGGMIYLTFTPLLGVSDVVMRFLKETSPDRADIVMTIEDAEHIPEAERAKIIASYPAHERDARTRGVPILGSGRIYPIPRDVIAVEPFAIPRWWHRIAAMDFGWDHPTAAVNVAIDRDADCFYVTHAYRVKEAPVHTHAAALKAWGKVPFAWPHDGMNSTAGAPDPLAAQYGRAGLLMLSEPASYGDDRRNYVEAGVQDLLDRMHTGRLKVFSHLADWFEEHDLYHRKDGKIFKERDDLMDATRYAVMAARFARAGEKAPVTDRYATKLRAVHQSSGWA